LKRFKTVTNAIAGSDRMGENSFSRSPTGHFPGRGGSGLVFQRLVQFGLAGLMEIGVYKGARSRRWRFIHVAIGLASAAAGLTGYRRQTSHSAAPGPAQNSKWRAFSTDIQSGRAFRAP